MNELGFFCFFFHAVHGTIVCSWMDMADEKKDYLRVGVDEPQAQFQRTTSNLGHTHKTSGRKEPSGLLSSLINMDKRKERCVCIACPTSWPLISLSNICCFSFFPFFSTLRRTKKKEADMLHLLTFIFFTAAV